MYEGDSFINLGDHWLKKSIADLINSTFTPASMVMDLLFQPLFNWIFNDLLHPYILHRLIIPFDLMGYGKYEYDVDYLFTKRPIVKEDALEIFWNAGVNILHQPVYAELPHKELKFIENEKLGFQLAISDFVSN